MLIHNTCISVNYKECHNILSDILLTCWERKREHNFTIIALIHKWGNEAYITYGITSVGVHVHVLYMLLHVQIGTSICGGQVPGELGHAHTTVTPFKETTCHLGSAGIGTRTPTSTLTWWPCSSRQSLHVHCLQSRLASSPVSPIFFVQRTLKTWEWPGDEARVDLLGHEGITLHWSNTYMCSL
jgi:hypothetical protein